MVQIGVSTNADERPTPGPAPEEPGTGTDTRTSNPETNLDTNFDTNLDLDLDAELDAALGAALATPTQPAPAAPALEDPLLQHLRDEATVATGAERASLLERLAGLLERQGDLGAAADTLLDALAADAERELTWGWLDALVAGDERRTAKVAALRLVSAPSLTLDPEETPAPPETSLAARPTELLERALAAARSDPADVDALLEVAHLAGLVAASAAPFDRDRLTELCRLALSLAAFVAPGRAEPPELPPLATALSEAARDRIALPAAIGPVGKLLALLAPHLEPLFPADLARRGATSASRLLAPHAPGVREPLEAAAALLTRREHAIFLVDRPGAVIAIENSRPPALVVPTGFEPLPAGVRRFLAARTIDQLERGWALVGKFAPRDVGILLELACRFAGGQPPPLGLPPARAGAFLSAMARGVPPAVAAQAASLGVAAADELASLELPGLPALLQRTGSRVALLATGDPGSAMAAMLAIEPPAVPLSPAEALRLPALHELATLALSESFLDLRVAVVG
jgi:hypothetical protein